MHPHKLLLAAVLALGACSFEDAPADATSATEDAAPGADASPVVMGDAAAEDAQRFTLDAASYDAAWVCLVAPGCPHGPGANPVCCSGKCTRPGECAPEDIWCAIDMDCPTIDSVPLICCWGSCEPSCAD